MSDSFFSPHKMMALKKIRADFAVEVLLVERLQKLGVNSFKTYLNTLDDLISKNVISSKTLFEETLGWVESEQLPNYVQALNEIFSRRFSFEAKDRVKALDMPGFERIVIDIVNALTSAPSINLSKRSIKPLDVETVHAALKYQIPEVDIDSVYVTSFIVELGVQKVIQSRSLVEDLYAHLQDDEIPFYSGEGMGVYSVAYSAEERHLHPQLTATDIRDLVIEIVPDFLV